MTQMSLEPYAVEFKISLSETQPIAWWEQLLIELLDGLGSVFSSEKGYLIGHIKAIAILPEKGLMWGSKISDKYKAKVNWKCKPQVNCSELLLTLNVLVYNVSLKELKCLINDLINCLEKTYAVKVKIITCKPDQAKTNLQVN